MPILGKVTMSVYGDRPAPLILALPELLHCPFLYRSIFIGIGKYMTTSYAIVLGSSNQLLSLGTVALWILVPARMV